MSTSLNGENAVLHARVLFVGDRPSISRNKDVNTPFVGTQSYSQLLSWMARMELDFRLCDMVNSYKVDGTEDEILSRYIKFEQASCVVALGGHAKYRLLEVYQDLIRPPPTFYLPHPSGLNRELNDKAQLASLLSRCKAFVYKA